MADAQAQRREALRAELAQHLGDEDAARITADELDSLLHAGYDAWRTLERVPYVTLMAGVQLRPAIGAAIERAGAAGAGASMSGAAGASPSTAGAASAGPSTSRGAVLATMRVESLDERLARVDKRFDEVTDELKRTKDQLRRVEEDRRNRLHVKSY